MIDDDTNDMIIEEIYYQGWLEYFSKSLAKAVEEGNFQRGRIEIARDEVGKPIGFDTYVVPQETLTMIPLKMTMLPDGVSFDVSTD